MVKELKILALLGTSYLLAVPAVAQTVPLEIGVKQGTNTSGDQANPFLPGGVELSVTNASEYKYVWGATKISGTFCSVSGSLVFFGAEYADPILAIPKVSQTATIAIEVRKLDGTRTGSRRIYVRPLDTGCADSPPPGNGAPENVAITAVPTTVALGGTISLTGNATDPNGDTLTWAWFANTTSQSAGTLFSNSRQTSYQAPYKNVDLYITLVVSDGKAATSKTILIKVGTGGGGTAPVGTCSASGAPAAVIVGSDTRDVIGGQSLTLEGQGTDPTATPGVPQTVNIGFQWSIADPKGLSFSFSDSLAPTTNLSTPVVDISQTVTVQLKVTDPDTSKWCTDFINVTVRGQSEPSRSAGINYAIGNQAYQAVSNGATVAREVPSFPVEVKLQGVSQGYSSPVFLWEKVENFIGSFSSTNTQNTTFTFQPVLGSTTLSNTLVLTVTEDGNAATASQTAVTFQVTESANFNPPVDVSFSVLPGLEAEPGTIILLEGEAFSGNEPGHQDTISYHWSVYADDGTQVEVMTKENRAMFIVPELPADVTSLIVELVASERGVNSNPEVRLLSLLLPTLNFAYFGVGALPGEELMVELIIVNGQAEETSPSPEGVDAVMEFFSQSGEPVELEVDGELSTTAEFSLGPTSARRFTLRSPDAEVRQGWLTVRAPIRLAGVVLFKYVNDMTGKVRTETALFSSTRGGRMTTVVSQGANSDLGLAIANPTSSDLELRLVLKEEGSGDEVIEISKSFDLPAHASLAKFLPEMVNPALLEIFRGGTLSVELETGVEGGYFIGTVLRLQEGFLSTIPVDVR